MKTFALLLSLAALAAAAPAALADGFAQPAVQLGYGAPLISRGRTYTLF